MKLPVLKLEALVSTNSKNYGTLLNEEKNFKKLHGSFLWMGFNCPRATEPLQGNSLLLNEHFQ